MAFKTSSEVIAEFQSHFPDCDSTTAASLFLNAIQEIGRDLNLFHDSASLKLNANGGTYNLVSSAGSPWYALGDTTTKATSFLTECHDVYYVTSSTERTQLQPITTKELSDSNPEWRYADSGTPQYFYLTSSSGGAITFGLYPKPDTATSPSNGTGYPRVDLYYRVVPASATEVPDVLRNDDAVLLHMLMRYALRVGDGRHGNYNSLFLEARGRALKSLHSNQREHPMKFTARRSYPVV